MSNTSAWICFLKRLEHQSSSFTKIILKVSSVIDSIHQNFIVDEFVVSGKMTFENISDEVIKRGGRHGQNIHWEMGDSVELAHDIDPAPYLYCDENDPVMP